MRLIAQKPCSFGGNKFFIGEEVPTELVTNPKMQEKLWQEEYEKLKKDLSKSCLSVGAISAQGGCGKPPYFYTGMMSHEKEGG